MTIVLLGGGGHASDVLAVIEAIESATGGGRDRLVYVADDAWTEPERFEGRRPVKLVESILSGARLGPFVVSVGYPGGRRAIHDLAVGAGGEAAEALVHPHASVAGGSLGPGVVVMGQTWLSPGVRIGGHTHVGYGATVGHDTVMRPFTSVMPGACIGGDVVIGQGVLIGANSTVLQGVEIGDGAVIGAGAVVTGDVAEGMVVVGVPARPVPQ